MMYSQNVLNYDGSKYLTGQDPFEITIAGSVTRQQHKLAHCVVANIYAEFTDLCGNDSWTNFCQTFALYKTERTVNNVLRDKGFFLERIKPSSSGKAVLQFRVREEGRNDLDTLAAQVANGSLAKLILASMIPGSYEKYHYALNLQASESYFDNLKEKCRQIQRNLDENYGLYEDSKRVGEICENPALPVKKEMTLQASMDDPLKDCEMKAPSQGFNIIQQSFNRLQPTMKYGHISNQYGPAYNYNVGFPRYVPYQGPIHSGYGAPGHSYNMGFLSYVPYQGPIHSGYGAPAHSYNMGFLSYVPYQGPIYPGHGAPAHNYNMGFSSYAPYQVPIRHGYGAQ